MWISNLSSYLVILLGLLDISRCLPERFAASTEKSLPRRVSKEALQIDSRGRHSPRLTTLPVPETLLSHALAIRDQAIETNKTERPVAQDLTFLIPSQGHIDLLQKIYSDFRTAIVNAVQPPDFVITAINDEQHFAHVAWNNGVLIFSVFCIGEIHGWNNLLDIANVYIDAAANTMWPVAWVMFTVAANGLHCWGTLNILGRIGGRQPNPTEQAWLDLNSKEYWGF